MELINQIAPVIVVLIGLVSLLSFNEKNRSRSLVLIIAGCALGYIEVRASSNNSFDEIIFIPIILMLTIVIGLNAFSIDRRKRKEMK